MISEHYIRYEAPRCFAYLQGGHKVRTITILANEEPGELVPKDDNETMTFGLRTSEPDGEPKTCDLIHLVADEGKEITNGKIKGKQIWCIPGVAHTFHEVDTEPEQPEE